MLDHRAPDGLEAVLSGADARPRGIRNFLRTGGAEVRGFDATSFGATCVQSANQFLQQDEDCLVSESLLAFVIVVKY